MARAAAALNEEMTRVAERSPQGPGAVFSLRKPSCAFLARDFTEVEYLELRAHDDLRLLDRADVPCRLFAAAWLAGVRLIDNIDVPRANQEESRTHGLVATRCCSTRLPWRHHLARLNRGPWRRGLRNRRRYGDLTDAERCGAKAARPLPAAALIGAPGALP